MLQYVVIRQPHHFVALCPEICRALGVIFATTNVAQTVHFNDQPCFCTVKVNDERTHGVLPTESEPCKLSSAQDLPELPFGIRRIAS